MEFDNTYEIQFSGLKVGKHEFQYKINQVFFEQFTDEVYNVDLDVKVFLEKQSTMLVFDFDIIGDWVTPCDTCGDQMEQLIDCENRLFVKFGNEESTNEDVIVLPPNDFEINVSPFIYEYFMLGLPLRNTHEEGKCNEEVLKALAKFAPKEEQTGTNPMWDKLKDLN